MKPKPPKNARTPKCKRPTSLRPGSWDAWDRNGTPVTCYYASHPRDLLPKDVDLSAQQRDWDDGHGSDWCPSRERAEHMVRGEGLSKDCLAAIRDGLRAVEGMDFSHARQAWKADVAGGFAHVPRYVAGDDRCMMRRAQTLNDSAPLRVWVPAVVSAGISDEECARRAGIVAGAIEALSLNRPVDLMLYAGSGSRWGVIQVAELPSGNSRVVAGWLCTAGARSILLCDRMAADRHANDSGTSAGTGDWPFQAGGSAESWAHHLEQWFGFTKETDILVPPQAIGTPAEQEAGFLEALRAACNGEPYSTVIGGRKK